MTTVADSERKILFRDGGTVSPEAASDQSTVKDVLGLLQGYVPQAVSGAKEAEKKEKVLWAKFETGDLNDMTLAHLASESQGGVQGAENSALPLVLTLGFTNGFSLWMIPPGGDASELFSCCGDEETARTVRLLKSPETVKGLAPDAFADKRPILAVVKRGRCSENSAFYSTLHLISLRSPEDSSWGKPFKKYCFKLRPIMDVKCNRRIVAVVLQKRIVVLDAGSLEYRFIIKNDYPSSTFPCNPIALGTKWLAYSETKLSSKHQSVGGMSHTMSSSVATTMLKSVKKGISALSETISGLTTKAQNSGPVVVYDRNPEEAHISYANIITVVDTMQSFPAKFELKLQDLDRDSAAVVAHFVAHAGPDVHIAALQFNPSGNLLLSASTEGHTFHLFMLLPHPLVSSETAVHHLYSLYRGATYGVVQDISFSLDSRWVVVSTLNGTSHAFPISPYGGEATVRTHISSKVVNRMSRFHTSAGMDSFINLSRPVNVVAAPSSKSSQSHTQAPPPSSSHFVGAVNGYNTWSSPRSLPLPNPIVTYALQQIKQPYQSLQAIAGMSGKFGNSGGSGRSETGGGGGGGGGGGAAGRGSLGRGGGVKASSSTESDILLEGGDGVCVRAVFGCDDGRQHSSNVGGGREEGRSSYSLYILGANGVLVKHCLQPRKLESAPDGEDAPITLRHHSQMQWRLMGSPPSVNPGYTPLPLCKDHPLIKANDAYLRSLSPTARDKLNTEMPDSNQPPSSSDLSSDDKWLSQVEILTHAPPSRRLWMGPQFSFKTSHSSSYITSSQSTMSALPGTSSSQASTALINTPSPPNTTITYSGSLNSSSFPTQLAAVPQGMTRAQMSTDISAEGTAVLFPSDGLLLDLDSPDYQSLVPKSLDLPAAASSASQTHEGGVVVTQDNHDTGMLEVCGSWNKFAPTYEGLPSFSGEVERQLEDAMGEVDFQNVTLTSNKARTGFSPPSN